MTRTTTSPARATRRSMSAPARRRTAVAVLAAAVLAASASVASAAPLPASSTTPPAASSGSPTSPATVTVDGNTVTITVSLSTMQHLCAAAPAAETHLNQLITRIQGGADVSGSAASVLAKADTADAAGHAAAATQLRARAARRTAHVPQLESALARVQQAATVCASIPAGS